jgi:hypothetical protein
MRSSCCLCVPANVARQRNGKHGLVATNIHTTEELLDTSVFYAIPVVSNIQYVVKEVNTVMNLRVP